MKDITVTGKRRALITKSFRGGWGVDRYEQNAHSHPWRWAGWTHHDHLYKAIRHAVRWRFWW